MSNKYPVEIDGKTGEVDDLPQSKGRYRCKLDTLQDVRREMSKTYRETRGGQIDPQTGSKLVWMLQAIGKVIEGHDLEKRIEILEGKQS
ncbi:MAG: hypothetical protein ACXW1Z_19055 [Methylobacter sp.]